MTHFIFLYSRLFLVVTIVLFNNKNFYHINSFTFNPQNVQKLQHRRHPNQYDISIDKRLSSKILLDNALFATTRRQRYSTIKQLSLSSNDNNNNESESEPEPKPTEAEKLRQQADILRQQIRDMESKMDKNRRLNNNDQYIPKVDESKNSDKTRQHPLQNKRVLVVGANGRLGSMVCRYLLRTYGNYITECVAAVHTVSENSSTSRGYGRLSYEVGAEDGIGTITPAWQIQDNEDGTTGSYAQFQFNVETMSNYNLNKLRIVECELLDPIQCTTITENIDIVLWCATDFNGNTPRAIGSLNIAFLFRAIASPTKGRVEIEGLQNILNGFTYNRLQQTKRQREQQTLNDEKNNNSNNYNILDFVLVSMIPNTYENFETPFGEFNSMKRQGENMLLNDYPSLSSTILQMAYYDDNFIGENLPLLFVDTNNNNNNVQQQQQQQQETSTIVLPKFINRRDAAKATVDAILNNNNISIKIDSDNTDKNNSNNNNNNNNNPSSTTTTTTTTTKFNSNINYLKRIVQVYTATKRR